MSVIAVFEKCFKVITSDSGQPEEGEVSIPVLAKDPLRAQFLESTGLVVGHAFHPDGTPACKFVGHIGVRDFDVVAAIRYGSEEVISPIPGISPSVAHAQVLSMAERLDLRATS